jgi:hypothetical protein
LPSNWTDYIFIVVVVLLLIWSLTRRRRSTGNSNIDAVGGVLTEVDTNLRILDERMTNWQSKKMFQTRAWKTYRDRLQFLEPSLTSSINESFALVEEFNSRIDSARKNRAMATLQDMPLEKLKEPLNKSKEGLITWLKANYQTQTNQRRGCSGF